MSQGTIQLLLFLQRTWRRRWVQVLLLDAVLVVGWDFLYDNWADICMGTFVPFLLLFNLTAAAVAALCRSSLWRWLAVNAVVMPIAVAMVVVYRLIRFGY